MNISEYSVCLDNAAHNREMADMYEVTYNLIVASRPFPGVALQLAHLDMRIQTHDRLSHYWMRQSDVYRPRYYR
jgi:hypothetical protein